MHNCCNYYLSRYSSYRFFALISSDFFSKHLKQQLVLSIWCWPHFNWNIKHWDKGCVLLERVICIGLLLSSFKGGQKFDRSNIQTHTHKLLVMCTVLICITCVKDRLCHWKDESCVDLWGELVGWLIVWLVGGLISWLIDWLADWKLLVDLLINWLVAGWIVGWFTDWFVVWLVDWLVDCLADWLVDQLIVYTQKNLFTPTRSVCHSDRWIDLCKLYRQVLW